MAHVPSNTAISRASIYPPSLAAYFLGRVRVWYARKSPVLFMVGKFVAFTAVFCAATFFPFYGRFLDAYICLNARLGSTFLNWIGEQSHVCESTIWSEAFSVTILRTCAALEYSWFICAAILATPISLPRKVPGILAGCTVLPALNLLRAVSLYFIGVHFPRAFPFAHEEVWGLILVMATIGVLILGLSWGVRNSKIATNVD